MDFSRAREIWKDLLPPRLPFPVSIHLLRALIFPWSTRFHTALILTLTVPLFISAALGDINNSSNYSELELQRDSNGTQEVSLPLPMGSDNETDSRRRALYLDAIIFPQTVLPLSSRNATSFDSNANNRPEASSQAPLSDAKCVTIDGQAGVCRSILACEASVHFQTLFTHQVVECGLHSGDIELICCPQWVGTPSAPSDRGSSSTLKDTAPAAAPSSVPTLLPGLNNNNNQNANENNVVAPNSPTTIGHSTSTPPSQDYDAFSANEAHEGDEVCGIYDASRANVGNNQFRPNGGLSWPWIVSIGRRHRDGSINFRCLGSLITKKIILSTAQCVQRAPNVVLIGRAYLGRMSGTESTQFTEALTELAGVEFHERYKQPFMYQNIGIVRLKTQIDVTTERLPICFPFLAGVLDIIPFAGVTATTIGFDISKDISQINFGFEKYTILNMTRCSEVISSHKAELKDRFAFGVKSDHMCGLVETPSTLCQAPGSPLVIFDNASESHVIIGISTGDPTCNEMKRQIVTFTRINAFSTWVRDRVGKLPNPPPCYVN